MPSDLSNLRLDTSTAEGLNASTVLACFRLAGMELEITKKRGEHLLLEFQWKDEPRFTGSIHASNGEVKLNIGFASKKPIEHTLTIPVRTVEDRIALGKEVTRVLRYMGFFRGEGHRSAAG